jgi:hypothetical protein
LNSAMALLSFMCSSSALVTRFCTREFTTAKGYLFQGKPRFDVVGRRIKELTRSR